MNVTKRVVLSIFAFLVFLTAFAGTSFLLSFKTQYSQQFLQISNKFDVDLSLAMAIARAESKFDKSAKSAKNAIGIMQIKLETANYVQAKYGGQILSEQELFLPSNNILCGIEYIAYLKTRFQGEDEVICAYNAGETTVANWLSNNLYSADGKTLTDIPYPETKNYLAKVKLNKKIYQAFFGY